MSINPEILERLRNNDPKLTELDLDNEKTLSYEDIQNLIQALQGNEHLEKLELCNTGIGDEEVALLAQIQNKQLQSLDLSNNQIGSQGVAALKRNTTIVHLIIQKNPLGPEGASELAQMVQLETLDINWCGIKDEGFQALMQLPNLRELWTMGNSLTDEAVVGFSQKAPELKELRMFSNYVTNKGFEELSRHPKLELLEVEGNELEEGALKPLEDNVVMALVCVGRNRVPKEEADRLRAEWNRPDLQSSKRQTPMDKELEANGDAEASTPKRRVNC